MLTGLAATDGRSQPKRKRRAAIADAVAASPATPPERRCCSDPTCVPIVSVPADFSNVADSLLQTLHDLAEVANSPTDGDYAMHLFERLRMVYFGLGSQQWFHDWHVSRGDSE